MKRYLEILAMILKVACFALVGAALGYIIGDEIEQRKLRSDLRSLCQEEFISRMGEPQDELAELIIKYQCRNAIP